MEKVLCIPSQKLDEFGRFDGFQPFSLEQLQPLLHPENHRWIAREEAEYDNAYKQIIPYAVIRRDDQIFKYQRAHKGGERRLEMKYSLGIGGHINPIDGSGTDVYQQAFLRELDEEVTIQGDWTHKVIGLVNDDATDVGAVHLGIVHLVTLAPNTQIAIKDPALQAGSLTKWNLLRTLIMPWESWSLMVLHGALIPLLG